MALGGEEAEEEAAFNKGIKTNPKMMKVFTVAHIIFFKIKGILLISSILYSFLLSFFHD